MNARGRAFAIRSAVIGTVSSGVVVYHLPGTGTARVLWGTGRGGFRRTGAAVEVILDVNGYFD